MTNFKDFSDVIKLVKELNPQIYDKKDYEEDDLGFDLWPDKYGFIDDCVLKAAYENKQSTLPLPLLEFGNISVYRCFICHNCFSLDCSDLDILPYQNFIGANNFQRKWQELSVEKKVKCNSCGKDSTDVLLFSYDCSWKGEKLSMNDLLNQLEQWCLERWKKIPFTEETGSIHRIMDSNQEKYLFDDLIKLDKYWLFSIPPNALYSLLDFLSIYQLEDILNFRDGVSFILVDLLGNGERIRWCYG